MTDQRLRELLHERVADVPATDLASGAWQDAVRTRRRRTAGILAGTVAGVVAVAALAAVVGGEPGSDPEPPTSSPSDPTSAAPSSVGARRAGEYEGAPVWWAPLVEHEADLPRLTGTPLLAQIDPKRHLSGPVPEGARAIVVFEGPGMQGVVWVHADTGAIHELDIGHLDRVADEHGNVRSPLSDESLSPDGRHVFFIQESSLEVYDLTDGTWTTIDTPDWLAEGARWWSDEEIWVPDRLGSLDGGVTYHLDAPQGGQPTHSGLESVWSNADDEPYGPVRTASDSAAQAHFLRGPVEGGDAWSPEAVVVRRGDEHTILAMPYGLNDVGPPRGQGCCDVVGWLDADTVLFVQSSTQRILAWDVGTERMYRVSEFAGGPSASFADLTR